MVKQIYKSESKNPHEVDSTTDKVQRRKFMKHMVEKRRRNRINHCLEQMRILVLKAQNKNPENYNKMEKADILEMTTSFLSSLHQQKLFPQENHQKSSLNQHKNIININNMQVHARQQNTHIQDYKNGYDLCQKEIQNYLNQHIRKQLPDNTSLISPITMKPLKVEIYNQSDNLNSRISQKSNIKVKSYYGQSLSAGQNSNDSLLMVCDTYRNNYSNNSIIVNSSKENSNEAMWRPW